MSVGEAVSVSVGVVTYQSQPEVLGELLEMGADEIARLSESGVI